MKLCWSLAIALSIIFTVVSAESSDLWDENGEEVLIRSIRATKDRSSGSSKTQECRYNKSEWSKCDDKLNSRNRTLTLKKGGPNCEQTKMISKKCKKACRYDKGTWSACIDNEMKKIDTLKGDSDASCNRTRSVTKKCKPETSPKKSSKENRANKKTGGKQ